MLSAIKEMCLFMMNHIDKKMFFVFLSITFLFIYYINPLEDNSITSWDRSFSSAVISGISINKRITNFYAYFFIYIPFTFAVVAVALSTLFYLRPIYKIFFVKFTIAIVPFIIASYISKFSSYTVVNENLLLESIVSFYIIFVIIGLFDKNQRIEFTDIVITFLIFEISVVSICILFNLFNLYRDILIINSILIAIFVSLLKCYGSKIVSSCLFNIFLVLMWLPFVIRFCLEVLYYLCERGYDVENYHSLLIICCLVYIVLSFMIGILATKKSINLRSFGYIGALTSSVLIAFTKFNYQTFYEYGNFANIYELGNSSVAIDSFLYGKVPVIDYFSAHALSDVLSRLIYCFLHNDPKGILVDPYNFLNILSSLVILYFILKNLFGSDFSILLLLLFPIHVVSIKGISPCILSILILMYILGRNSYKYYILFWFAVLLSAFMSYDEGFSLGLSCILSYIFYCLVKKRDLLKFLVCGSFVGCISFSIFLLYSVYTGLPVFSRISEWVSVSIGSSSFWATSNFGDPSSLAFFVSYFVVPSLVVLILICVIFSYKRNIKLAILTFTFSLTVILFIPRSIVFHNLAICSGKTGVLLNYIHWSIAFFVIFLLSKHKFGINTKVIAFSLSFLAVIIIEGAIVTHYLPCANSTLANKTLIEGKKWSLKDNYRHNIGNQRIVLGENTQKFVQQFRTVFDSLLTEDQTFIDFANITSLYFFTDRKRPSYVGQTPSLLTNLYSQQNYLEEVSKYDCPLAILGTTENSYLQQMAGVPHNVRYYKIAEYIYQNYRPLVKFDEFVVWCKNSYYYKYKQNLLSKLLSNKEYTIVDYGYDFTISNIDENGNMHWKFFPYHNINLVDIPYIWANFDNFKAVRNSISINTQSLGSNYFSFKGSQYVVNKDGNYLSFVIDNISTKELSVNIVLWDSNNDGAKFSYQFTVKPGKNTYLIRISQDYFWYVYNIDSLLFGKNDSFSVSEVSILEGD